MNEEKVTLDFEMKDDVSSKAKNLKENLKSTEKQANSTGKALDSMSENSSKSISNLSKSFKSGVLGAAVRKVANYMITSSKASADYIESLNLLGVAFEGDTKAIREFTSTTAGKLNLDEATLINAAGHFRTLADSMNLSSEAGKDFSQLLTQLNLDLSSLFNVDFDRMQRALQSAVEGQGKSLKQLTGASVLETSVQTQLTALGVDAYVEDMNDSEKAIARLIAITYQLQSAQGDLANTINAPANQMRVFGEQASMLARNIGNILLPVLSALLPILNGILIAINSILSGIAKLFGFKESDYDFVTDTTDSFNNLGGAVGGVGDAAKKAKKELSGLRGFDKLNVIRTPQDSSGGGGGGGGGTGVNPKLLKTLADLLGQYDSKLDGVRTKAQDIADAILEWLHVFDKLKEPMEHLASLTFDGIIYLWENALKPLAKWVGYELIPAFVDLTAEGLELIYQVGLRLKPIYKFIFDNILSPFARVLGKTIVNTLEDIAKFINILSKNKLATQILAWVIAFKQLKTVTSILTKVFGKTALGKSIMEISELLKDGKNSVRDYKAAWDLLVEKITPKITRLKTATNSANKALIATKNTMNVVKTAATGMAIAFAGFEVLKSAFQDIAKNGATVGNVLGVVAGAIVLVSGAVVALNAVFAIFNVTLMSNPIFLIGAAIAATAIAIGTLIGATSKHTEEVKKNTEETNKNIQKLKELGDQAKENAEADLVRLDKAKEYKDILYDTLDANDKIKSGEEDRANKALANLNEQLGTTYKIENGMITTEDGLVIGRENLNKEIENTISKLRAEAILEAYKDQYIQALQTQTNARNTYNSAIEESDRQLQLIDQDLKNGKITQEEAAQKAIFWEEQKQQASKDYNDAIDKSKEVVSNYEDLVAAKAKGSTDEINKSLNNFDISSGKTMGNVTVKTEKEMKKIKDNINNKYKAASDDANKHLNNIKLQSSFTLDIDANTKKAKESLQSFFKRNSAVFGAAGLNIPTIQYAQGGLPSVGQMFIANERGPELVGQIGGQSFVANQNQMMNIIDKKLQNAGGGIKNATFIVQVGNEQIGKVVINDLNKMAKSNGKPIVIGG